MTHAMQATVVAKMFDRERLVLICDGLAASAGRVAQRHCETIDKIVARIRVNDSVASGIDRLQMAHSVYDGEARTTYDSTRIA